MIKNSCDYGTYNKLGGVKIHHLLLKILLISLILCGALSCVNTYKIKNNNIKQTLVSVNNSVASDGDSTIYYITRIVPTSNSLKFVFNYSFDEDSFSKVSYKFVMSTSSVGCNGTGSNYFILSFSVVSNSSYHLMAFYTIDFTISGKVNGVDTKITFLSLTKYIESQVDITSDNQSAIDNYINENNYHTDEEYNNYGNTKYQEGYNAGSSGVGYSEEEYLAYGQQKYNEGTNSVDITTDNQSAIDNYINENNYHTDEDYNSYGNIKYAEGVIANYNDNLTYINGLNYYNNSYFKYNKFEYNTEKNCYINRINNILERDYFKCNIYKKLFVLYNNNYYDIITINYKNITYKLKCNLYFLNSDFNIYNGYNGYIDYAIGSPCYYYLCMYFDNTINYDFSSFTNSDYVNIANIIQQKYKFCFKNYDTNDYYLGFDIGSAIYDYCIDNVVCFDKENYLNYGLGQFNAGVKKAENDKSFGQMVFAIVDAPFNVFRNAFDFEILGINLSVFLISIVSLMFISFVIKKLI